MRLYGVFFCFSILYFVCFLLTTKKSPLWQGVFFTTTSRVPQPADTSCHLLVYQTRHTMRLHVAKCH